MKNNLATDEIRKGCKDVFNAHIVYGAVFNGFYDIPSIPQPTIQIPKTLIAYDKTAKHRYPSGEFVHFYLDDQKFDGPKGIWNSLRFNQNNKRGFGLERLEGVSGIITPDYSLYMDMPRVMQIWNVYRSRAIGYYLTTLGYYVIPNVRWTDEESYKYAFAGLSEGMVVAVGTLGCGKKKEDKNVFLNGFLEMIKRIKPKTIVIYGSLFKELKLIIEKNDVDYAWFDSDISIAFGGAKNGIES